MVEAMSSAVERVMAVCTYISCIVDFDVQWRCAKRSLQQSSNLAIRRARLVEGRDSSCCRKMSLASLSYRWGSSSLISKIISLWPRWYDRDPLCRRVISSLEYCYYYFSTKGCSLWCVTQPRINKELRHVGKWQGETLGEGVLVHASCFALSSSPLVGQFLGCCVQGRGNMKRGFKTTGLHNVRNQPDSLRVCVEEMTVLVV